MTIHQYIYPVPTFFFNFRPLRFWSFIDASKRQFRFFLNAAGAAADIAATAADYDADAAANTAADPATADDDSADARIY